MTTTRGDIRALAGQYGWQEQAPSGFPPGCLRLTYRPQGHSRRTVSVQFQDVAGTRIAGCLAIADGRDLRVTGGMKAIEAHLRKWGTKP